MYSINFIVGLSLVLLVGSSVVKGQTTTPGYDNIYMEKAMDPLHKIKLALIAEEAVQQTQMNHGHLTYNTDIFSLYKHSVTTFDPVRAMYKVKPDYMPKLNMGLLYNKFQY